MVSDRKLQRQRFMQIGYQQSDSKQQGRLHNCLTLVCRQRDTASKSQEYSSTMSAGVAFDGVMVMLGVHTGRGLDEYGFTLAPPEKQ